MPIRAEMRHLYPPAEEWAQIRKSILQRAQYRCERCCRPNLVPVYVCPDGEWQLYCVETTPDYTWHNEHGVVCPEPENSINGHVTKTVLTIAHLDHDPQNNALSNLRAYCQRCHLCHDAAEHASNARRTRARKRGQAELPGVKL